MILVFWIHFAKKISRESNQFVPALAPYVLQTTSLKLQITFDLNKEEKQEISRIGGNNNYM